MKTGGWIILWLGVALMLTIGALWAQSKIPTTATTRTQRIELVDKDGRIRAELKTSGEDTLLVLYDAQGRLRTLVGTQSVIFYGTDGKLKAKIDAQNLSEEADKNQ
ncbi:MAG: hypothetical protein KatS3mg023_2377 [Armatimonadota bacterium]|nr:MAG: hypothetical protein KatS3mg023_2377 [Armatimonadota bacterium]